MLPLLFSFNVDGCKSEIKARIVNLDVKPKVKGIEQSSAACPFADNSVVNWQKTNGGILRGVVDEFDRVCIM